MALKINELTRQGTSSLSTDIGGTDQGQRQRIGIFGGTFDPVHLGHLRPAIEMCEILELDSVRLLPCHLPAHRDQPRASTEQRIQMLELVCADVPQLSVDDREARRSSPSYTVDTLRSFKKEFPHTDLLFFMGMDAFDNFTHWYHWEEILTLANLVIAARPGAKLSGAEERLMMSRASHSNNPAESAGQILQLDVAQFDISATRIRELLAQQRDVRFLLPESVRQFIIDSKLYQ